MTRPTETLTVKRESLPVRCEVCHQTDKFNPATGVCRRCSPVFAGVGGTGSSTDTHEVPPEFREAFSEIVGRERVLWIGRPDPNTARRRGVVKYLHDSFVGVFFLIVAVALNVQIWRGVDASFLPHLVFTLIPVLAGWFWYRKVRRQQSAVERTLYVLTERRAVILTPDKNADFESFELNAADLCAVPFNIPENPRVGGVIFEKRWKFLNTPFDWDEFSLGFRRYGVGFLCIEEFREVEQLVRRHAKSKKTR